MNDAQLWEERAHKVIKSNPLVQQANFDLSTMEQKLVLYLISKIKPATRKLEPVELSFFQFAQICGMSDKAYGGSYAEYIKSILLNLRSKAKWVKLEDKTQTIFSWIDEFPVITGNGSVIVKLSRLLEPYLLELYEQYTSYQLMYVLPMKSKYAIRLYELLKSWEGLDKAPEVPLAVLRKLLQTGDYYKRYPEFRVRVLEIAQREINQYTDINVNFTPIKNGRSVNKIRFEIYRKKNVNEVYSVLKEALDHGQEQETREQE